MTSTFPKQISYSHEPENCSQNLILWMKFLMTIQIAHLKIYNLKFLLQKEKGYDNEKCEFLAKYEWNNKKIYSFCVNQAKPIWNNLKQIKNVVDSLDLLSAAD